VNPTAHTASRAIPVARPSFGREEEEAVAEVLRSGWVAQGPRVAKFEERFAEYVGAKHAVAVSSCTTALHLALVSSGIGPGDEVLCPSFSFIATANAIVYAGARPVFVDIDRTTYNIDPVRLEEAVTPRTRAILVVHQVGLPAALDEIVAIAERRDLLVLEDAACAVGSEYRGRRIGAPHTALACFSFHPRKILCTGEGGMITTKDADRAALLRRLRQHAMSVSDLARHKSGGVVIESYNQLGYNYRMTDLQAALGLVQLRRLDDFLARRQYLAARYTERIAPLGWLSPPKEPEGGRHNFQSYMVRLPPSALITRDALMKGLLKRGIATRRGVMAIHREPPYKNPCWEERLPQTNAATDETIILPLFHQMTEEEQDYIIDAIYDLGAGAPR
jgi:dTDP-4-amino-4,6-dideoxygalactose transaminase